MLQGLHITLHMHKYLTHVHHNIPLVEVSLGFRHAPCTKGMWHGHASPAHPGRSRRGQESWDWDPNSDRPHGQSMTLGAVARWMEHLPPVWRRDVYKAGDVQSRVCWMALGLGHLTYERRLKELSLFILSKQKLEVTWLFLINMLV